MLRLYNLKKGSRIHDLDVKFKGRKKSKKVIVEFSHCDGMFSYNYVLDENGNKIKMPGKPMKNKSIEGGPIVVHLANATILKKIDDHYEIANEEEIKNFKD